MSRVLGSKQVVQGTNTAKILDLVDSLGKKGDPGCVGQSFGRWYQGIQKTELFLEVHEERTLVSLPLIIQFQVGKRRSETDDFVACNLGIGLVIMECSQDGLGIMFFFMFSDQSSPLFSL